jgi:hypothetical protein
VILGLALIPPATGSVRDELFMFLMKAFNRTGIEVAMAPGIPISGNALISPPPPEPAFRLYIGAKHPIPM